MGWFVVLLGGYLVVRLGWPWLKRSDNVAAEFIRFWIWRDWRPRGKT